MDELVNNLPYIPDDLERKLAAYWMKIFQIEAESFSLAAMRKPTSSILYIAFYTYTSISYVPMLCMTFLCNSNVILVF